MTIGAHAELTDPAAELRRRFVLDVASRAALPAHLTAEAATTAVMCAITERLTRGGAFKLSNALPAPISQLFQRCVEQHTGPVAPIDRATLLERTAEHLGVIPARAEVICCSVLHAVRQRLPPEVADDVAAQLPGDLKELWYAEPPLAPTTTVPETEAEAVRAEVFAEIERTGELPRGIDGAAAFMAVMCIFSQRLSGGEARHVLLGLPSTLRPLVTSCMIHRDEPATPFDRSELFRRVSEHLGTNADVATDITRAVFAAVKRCLPIKDIEDAGSQLPPDLRDVWLGA